MSAEEFQQRGNEYENSKTQHPYYDNEDKQYGENAFGFEPFTFPGEYAFDELDDRREKVSHQQSQHERQQSHAPCV